MTMGECTMEWVGIRMRFAYIFPLFVPFFCVCVSSCPNLVMENRQLMLCTLTTSSPTQNLHNCTLSKYILTTHIPFTVFSEPLTWHYNVMFFLSVYISYQLISKAGQWYFPSHSDKINKNIGPTMNVLTNIK